MTTSQSFERIICGRKLTLETGKLAWQAGAAVTVRYGDTVVLSTVCVAPKAKEGTDFLPLTVDYEERMYAAGKIPGGFLRREGRPSEEAILTDRLTDRPLRPLLPKAWRREIQLISTVLAVDKENDPSILSVIGCSAALSISSVPFEGPVGVVHVGYIDGKLVVNPTMVELQNSKLDLVIASTKKAVVMMEAGANEISEEIFAEAIRVGHEANQEIIALQEEMVQAVGKQKEPVPVIEISDETKAAVSDFIGDRLNQAFTLPTKAERIESIDLLKNELVEALKENHSEFDLLEAFDKETRELIRGHILKKGERVSGRRLNEVRPLMCEVGVLPRVHGSALFSRGETQILTVTTLGPIKKEQQIDGLGFDEPKRYIHHYNFPPFSTGEARRAGVTGRREYGHGALAERALLPVVPLGDDFPYTLRLVSEALSSNGSTSMASCCASTMSLMDAGIKIKAPVAGISIGLVTGEGDEYALLTDIEGIEDNYGDMDFKVAGTEAGITAVQLDIKPQGISADILIDALGQAREARMFILDKMLQTISESNPELSPYAPRMYKVAIPSDKIGTVIGPGGKTIRSIVDESKATVDINNEGIAIIGSADEASARKAMDMIDALIRDVEVGVIYTGKVTRIMNFGAFVEVLPGKEGMVHISELADYRVDKVEDVVKVGDEITVKVTEIDNQGRVNLSRRAAFSNASETPRDRQPRRRDNPSRPPRRSNPPQNKRRF
ncbi:MAG: polyribonucleotide nucleotidyltransferase [Dehalococcoidales bacterium]|nr:polyribonucleotide nucleotidyltransferase [Dehalococcoidales bacterium]